MVKITIMKEGFEVSPMTITRPLANPAALLMSPQTSDYSLLTDLYQLTMTACYVGEQLDQTPASFELFVRKLPKSFGYLIAMGLTQALEYLQNLRFSTEQIAALQGTGLFDRAPAAFWEVLATAKFTGNVWAVPEGTAIFANEPILRIEAPLWQAQIVETFLLNTINYQTLIATRAARLRDMAGAEATLLEFGTRRAFSPQAALWAARAAIAAGLDTTSNVLAALQLGVQPSGTMAHSLVMAIAAINGNEQDAFSAFQKYFPDSPLLVDTFDAVAAIEQLATQVQAGKMTVPGIRLDSGDLVGLSQLIHKRLPHTKVFASGDLDEWEIAKLRSAGAQIDGYGLGTKLVTGQPVNGVYKLVEIAGRPTMKKAAGKQTYPGQKQIYRQIHDGQWQGDTLDLADPERPGLLELVMADGRQLIPSASLAQIRDRTHQNVASLPAAVRDIDQPTPVTAAIGVNLAAMIQELS
jgi:nicotinate phosphoribosyltransferase